MKKRILVTGGAGFVGSRLSSALSDMGHSVLIADNLSNSTPGDIPEGENIQFIKKDVRDEDIQDLLIKHSIECIYHLAAVISITESVKHPLKTHTNNLDATINMLEASKAYGGIKKFIFSSSCSVYGDKPDNKIAETDPASPMSPYAIDKYSSELYIDYYGKNYNIPYVICRYFNIYGPPKSKITPYSGVIEIFRENISKKRDLEIYGTGEQKRDFIHVDDIIRANVFALENRQAEYRTLNVGSGRSLTINELADLMKRKYKSGVKIKRSPARKGDILYSTADTGLIESLGFNSGRDIESLI